MGLEEEKRAISCGSDADRSRSAILMDDSHELLSTIIALFGVVPLLVAADEVQLVFTMLFDGAASGWPLVARPTVGRLMLEFRLVLMLALLLLLVVAPDATCVT